jgi:hypothetical protein
VLGETPSGFDEIDPLLDERLPPATLVLDMQTNSEEWPDTEFSFRPDELPSDAFALDDGRKTEAEIDEATRSGCVPRRIYYR